jgi:transposase
VAAAVAPGAVASEVARTAGIHTSQLFRWRQELCDRAPMPAAFNSVVVTPDTGAVYAALPPSAPPPEPSGVIEIEFPTGGWMRITGAAPARRSCKIALHLRPGYRDRTLHNRFVEHTNRYWNRV